MIEDIRYCASSFLMYRTVADPSRCFSLRYPPYYETFPTDRVPVWTAEDLKCRLQAVLERETAGHRCALALSGGIDSAILLALMPENTVTYTFQCIVPGTEVTNEVPAALAYLRIARPELLHRVVPLYWKDFEADIPVLMAHKGGPTHSIEVQIYRAAQQAMADGCDLMVFGETADCIFGGHSRLLSRDWNLAEFVRRWSFVLPETVLRDPEPDLSPYERFLRADGKMDVPAFLSNFESEPSLNFYMNACAAAGIRLCAPYAHTVMAEPLDLARVRRGENKYLVRELFRLLYPGISIPPKTPMPRPMAEWLSDWEGPKDPMFLPDCVRQLSGDGKWLVYALDRFLGMIKEGDA